MTRAVGLLLMAGWTMAFASGWWSFATDGELLPLALAVAAGAAVPGIAYTLVRSRPGPLAICWAAAQVTLWSLIPLAVWTLLWAQPTTLLSLSAWLTVSLSAGAVLSGLLAPLSSPTPGGAVPTGAEPSGRDRVGPVLAVGVLLAGVGAWRLTTTEVLLEPTPTGVFAAHANFRSQAEPLLSLSEPTPGRWLTLAAAAAGGDSDESDPQAAAQRATLGEDVPLLPLGRAPLEGLNDETLQFLTAKAAYPGRAVLWSADGSAAAVLAGLGSTSNTLRVADVQIIWWDDPHRMRTSRQISPVPLAFRGAAWSPDGRRLALLTENRESPPSGPTLRLFIVDGTGGVRSVERDDLPDSLGTLVAWRSDGCLVFEGSDPTGHRVAEYWNPFAELTAEANKSNSKPEKPRPEPRRPLVGPPVPELPLPPVRPPERSEKRPRRTAHRALLPDGGWELCRSPDRRRVVWLRNATKATGPLVIWDHEREAETDISGSLDAIAPRLAKLPAGTELSVAWSADGSTLLIPPLEVDADSAGSTASALWVNWSASPPVTMQVRLPCAGRVDTIGPIQLSPDGRRLALMVELGSPVQLAKRLAASLPTGLQPELPKDEAESKASGATGTATVPAAAAATAAGSDGWRLRRALYVGDLGSPTGLAKADSTHWRRVGLLPAGRSRDAAGGSPQFHWLPQADDGSDALVVVLRRPDSSEQIRHLYRLVLPKR